MSHSADVTVWFSGYRCVLVAWCFLACHRHRDFGTGGLTMTSWTRGILRSSTQASMGFGATSQQLCLCLSTRVEESLSTSSREVRRWGFLPVWIHSVHSSINLSLASAGGTVQKYSYQFGTSPTCDRKPQYTIHTVRHRVVRQAGTFIYFKHFNTETFTNVLPESQHMEFSEKVSHASVGVGHLVNDWTEAISCPKCCYQSIIFLFFLVLFPVSVLGAPVNIRTTWRGFPTTITAAVSIRSNREPEGYKYYVFSRCKSTSRAWVCFWTKIWIYKLRKELVALLRRPSPHLKTHCWQQDSLIKRFVMQQ